MNTNTFKAISKLQSRYIALMGAIDLLVNNGWRPGRATRHILIKNSIIDVEYEKVSVSAASVYAKMVKDVCEHWDHVRFNNHFFQITTNENVIREAYENVSSCASSDAHLMHSCYVVPDVGMFLCIVTNQLGDIVSRAWTRSKGDNALFCSNYGYEHRMESILLAIGAKYTRRWADDVVHSLRCTELVIDPVTLKSSILEYTPIVDGITMEALYEEHCM